MNTYEIDLDEMTGIDFMLDKAWLDFVCQNRSGMQRLNLNLDELDYISGATADDKLFAIVEQYESNLIDVEVAIECMNAMKIGNQIALISQNAIEKLRFVGSYELSELRKTELEICNQKARKETNTIVSDVMRKRVEKINSEPAPLPIVHQKRGC